MSKNKNILDATDKNSGPRTCPECGYQFPLILFVRRFVSKFGFPKWTCPSCRQFIRYNYTRANLIGVVVFIICIVSYLGLKAKLGWDLPDYFFIFPYFFLGLILLNMDRLEKHEQ